jgi:uncharacterized protein
MALLTRRRALLLTGATGLALAGRTLVSRAVRAPEETGPLSPAAQALVDRAWEGLDPARTLDAHVHVVGTGVGGSGCFIGPRMRSWASPVDRLKFNAYAKASGIADVDGDDRQYVDRLLALAQGMRPHGRLLLFAFEQFHDEAGKAVPEASEFHTPNAYVLKLAQAHPDVFVACASIHPYRPDCVEALEAAVAQGAQAVKWLPNAMNIDPSSPRCDAFYGALARLAVPLISHAGEEKAVHAEEAQRLGNPLHLRRPLGQGVTVVVAHCASLGQNPDLDAPGAGWVDNFTLFLRLMGEPQWKGKLFGDTSAMAIVTRVGAPLRTVLREPQLQARLVNGSDYPLPAINVLMQTRAVENAGFITAQERAALNELDSHNPLLFDFVLKRTVAVREGGKVLRFSPDVFTARPEVFPRLLPRAL